MNLIPAIFMLPEHEDWEERKNLVEIPEWRVGYVCRRIKRLC